MQFPLALYIEIYMHGFARFPGDSTALSIIITKHAKTRKFRNWKSMPVRQRIGDEDVSNGLC